MIMMMIIIIIIIIIQLKSVPVFKLILDNKTIR
jgi:hypothetical protein